MFVVVPLPLEAFVGWWKSLKLFPHVSLDWPNTKKDVNNIIFPFVSEVFFFRESYE